MHKIASILLPVLLVGFMVPEYNDTSRRQSSLHAVQHDGPYVSYRNDRVFARYIMDDHGTKTVTIDSIALAEKKSLVLKVRTEDPTKTFSVVLKEQLNSEKAEYNRVNKMLAISD